MFLITAEKKCYIVFSKIIFKKLQKVMIRQMKKIILCLEQFKDLTFLKQNKLLVHDFWFIRYLTLS